MRIPTIIIIFIVFVNLILNPAASLADTYQQKTPPSSDGIGKVYLGREISQIMGHTGAGWLERPTREAEEQPSKVVSALNLKPTDAIADIGAGTGYFSFRIAPLVPQGKVFAVDIQPEMLEIINFFKEEKHVNNVEPVLATATDPQLPANSIDLGLMVDVYHEIEYPQEVMSGVVKALKPGGRAILVEYRAENPFVLIKRLHKMSQKQVKKEMQAAGLIWRETKNFLPQQHFTIFEKPV